MSEHPLAEQIKSQGGWLIALGIVTAVLGVLCMLSPLAAAKWVALMMGIAALFAGVGQCIFAFRSGSLGAGIFAFALGALTMLCGTVIMAQPLYGLTILTFLLIAYFIAEGLCEIVIAFQVRPMSGWIWMLISGAVSIAFGVFIWIKLPVSMLIIGILLGIKLLLLGSWMSMLGVAARSVAKRATG